MRSHATWLSMMMLLGLLEFQYRKRYEVTCDVNVEVPPAALPDLFQYRKRYEVTCDALLPIPIRRI